MKIGLDFDNTIASYELVFPEVAKKCGLVEKNWLGTRKELRDWLRNQPGGKLEWQKLQGLVYGRYMSKAELFPNVANFLLRCKRMNIELYIVSHKTEYGHFDADRVPLRKAALKWMKSKDFFNERKFGISSNAVFFSNTREEKVEQISDLQLDAFVDNLEEVYCEPNFPSGIKKILFGTESCKTNNYDVACSNWTEISRELLGNPSLEDYRYWAQMISDDEITAITELQGRGNSRVHRIQTENGTALALKTYPDRLLDSRNRIEAEFNACRYLEHTGRTPKAINLDKDLNMAIYEWIEGFPIKQIENRHIIEALSFTKFLWRNSQSLESSFFPLASEACLSAEQLFSQIGNRCEKLQENSNCFENLGVFLESVFKPTWVATRKWAESLWPFTNLKRTLLQKELTLSPSDFGFHNTLVRANGSLCFLDLEYFGFDDPVKLITDFIWHPAMSMNSFQKKNWVLESIKIFEKTPKIEARFLGAWPVIGLRWALILLNEFLKEGWEKRVHARQELAELRKEKLKKQLTKAELICEFITKHEMKCPYV